MIDPHSVNNLFQFDPIFFECLPALKEMKHKQSSVLEVQILSMEKTKQAECNFTLKVSFHLKTLIYQAKNIDCKVHIMFWMLSQ